MGRVFRVPMFAIACGLFGLIVLLATLQYRWLGQISGAERDRMTATLNLRATAFGQDFDRELTLAYLLFQVDPLQQDQNAAAGIVARHDRWQATAKFPRMIKDVYLIPPQTTAQEPAPLQRLNTATRFLEPSEWAASLTEVRKALTKATPSWDSSSTSKSTFLFRATMPTVWPSVPALVIAAPMLMVSSLSSPANQHASVVRGQPELRNTVLLLDEDYIKTEMLLALAQQHFQGTGDGFDYQLAVLPSGSRAPVYRSVPEFAPTTDTPVDAKVDLFQVRVKDFEPLVAEVSRFATFTALASSPTRSGQTIIRETISAPHANVAFGSAPMSFVLQGSTPAEVQERVDKLVAGSGASVGTRFSVLAPAPWHLLVKHPSGSLERAVNAARRRNIAVSTGILGVLALSVAFLVVSTRRAHDLARRQLEFVATVSHELRTPLAVIRSAADNLADGVVDDEARVRQYGQLVRREGLRLSELVEQVLEFAGLQSGARAASHSPVAIPAVLREAAAAAQPAADAAGVRVELSIADGLPAVAGDEAALRRVFVNLIGNAVKYGASAGWVGVRASAEGGHLEIGVSDRGIGIAPSEQDRIFEPFYRAPDVVAAQIQGAGLGLSLVKRIVDAHGGRVAVTSAPGQGSTFTVTLPVMVGDPAQNAAGLGEAAPQQS